MKKLLFFIFTLKLTSICFFAVAQSCFSVNSVVVPCTSNCATLSVTTCMPGLATRSTYSVPAISYAPYSYTGGTGAIGVGQDDIWSNVVNMPFYFCFFCNSYNRCVVGANII